MQWLQHPAWDGPDSKHRLIDVEWSGMGEPPALWPSSIRYRDELNRPFRLEATCFCREEGIELKQLLGRPVAFGVDIGSGKRRWLCGIITVAAKREGEGSFSVIDLQVESALSLLDRRRTCRIFQDQSVPAPMPMFCSVTIRHARTASSSMKVTKRSSIACWPKRASRITSFLIVSRTLCRTNWCSLKRHPARSSRRALCASERRPMLSDRRSNGLPAGKRGGALVGAESAFPAMTIGRLSGCRARMRTLRNMVSTADRPPPA